MDSLKCCNIQNLNAAELFAAETVHAYLQILHAIKNLSS